MGWNKETICLQHVSGFSYSCHCNLLNVKIFWWFMYSEYQICNLFLEQYLFWDRSALKLIDRHWNTIIELTLEIIHLYRWGRSCWIKCWRFRDVLVTVEQHLSGQSLFLFLHPPPIPSWARTRNWEETQLGQPIPIDQGDIPDPMVSVMLIKLGKKKGGDVWSDSIYLPK